LIVKYFSFNLLLQYKYLNYKFIFDLIKFYIIIGTSVYLEYEIISYSCCKVGDLA